MKKLLPAFLVLLSTAASNAQADYSRLIAQRNVIAGDLFNVPNGENTKSTLQMIQDGLTASRKEMSPKQIKDILTQVSVALCDPTEGQTGAIKQLSHIYSELMSTTPSDEKMIAAKKEMIEQKYVESIDPMLAYCGLPTSAGFSAKDKAKYKKGNFDALFAYSTSHSSDEESRVVALMAIIAE
jgi:hypothetical protein